MYMYIAGSPDHYPKFDYREFHCRSRGIGNISLLLSSNGGRGE